MIDRQFAKELATAEYDGDDMAADNFLGKYALHNLEGELLEAVPSDMHARIANALVEEERKHLDGASFEEIYYLMEERRWYPQGSPLYGIGNPYSYVTISNCFAAGTLVHTLRGPIPIEDVQIGDRVVTHTGSIKPVTQLHKNRRGDRGMVEVTVHGAMQPMLVTEDHQYWTDEGWVRASDLQGKMVRLGRPTEAMDGSGMWSLRDAAENLYPEIRNDGVYYTLRTEFEFVRYGKTSKSHKDCTPVKLTGYASGTWAWFLGLWMGDGCVFDLANGKVGGLTLTLNKKEEAVITKASSAISELFGLEASKQINEAQNTCTLRVNSELLGACFAHKFGRGFDGKRVDAGHYSLLSRNTYLAEQFIAGLHTADGTVDAAGDTRIVLSNERLMQQVYALSVLCGMKCTFAKAYRNPLATAQPYTVRYAAGCNLLSKTGKTYDDSRIEKGLERRPSAQLWDGDYTLCTSVEVSGAAPEYVYTLGVEDDHSYCVEGVVAQNCYVVGPLLDSYGSVMSIDHDIAQIYKRRGGCGISMDAIRPANSPVNNAARTSTGIVPFMEQYSDTTRRVGQSGRRGALMLTLNVAHPEILEFATAKEDLTKVTGANISIQVTDEFMLAVENGSDFTLRWPVEASPAEAKVTKVVNAAELYAKIVDVARRTGEPGIQYIDTIRRLSPADCYADVGFKTVSTNPCGEIPLNNGDACRLSLMNLSAYVIDPYTPFAAFDWGRFSKDSMTAMRLMDSMVSLDIKYTQRIIEKVQNDPEPEHVKAAELRLWNGIMENAIAGRRTGLGFTGLADALAKLGLRYGSQDSIAVTEHITKVLAVSAYTASIEMAKNRGSFPVFDAGKEENNPFINRILEELTPEMRRMYSDYGRRNIACLTCAPAGTISTILQTSSGIEPVFATHYKRRRKVDARNNDVRVDFTDDSGDTWQEYMVIHHGLREYARTIGVDVRTLSNDDVARLEDASPYANSTAGKVAWGDKLAIIAAAQKWIDHAISNTTNLPRGTTSESLFDIYRRAWKLDLKGCTVYVDGCRSGVLVTEEDERAAEAIVKTDAVKRPTDVFTKVHRVKHRRIDGAVDDYYVFVGEYEDDPYEVFIIHDYGQLPDVVNAGIMEKERVDGVARYNFCYATGSLDDVGSLMPTHHAVMARLCSLGLRHGASVHYLVEQLQKIDNISSFPNIFARVLKGYIKDGTSGTSAVKKCPKCGSEELRYEQSCLGCTCGWSKCS